MMRALILLHRWLGVAFGLLFAMWFATGIVMHFVPFPSLTETERVAGLMPLDHAAAGQSPAAAIAASGIEVADRVRLFNRVDGAVYLVSGAISFRALRASDGTSAAVTSERTALAIAVDHARRRGLDATGAAFVERADHDQWTVPNRYDPHRPLYRMALRDGLGTDLYISSATGEVLLDTTRHERAWNYVGSVAHWIYPTGLRRHWAAWDRTVWWLSLAAVFAAASGALLGSLRFRKACRCLARAPTGWHAWHHVLGLLSMTFVLTWIVSGWLSMDHGRLFSRGDVTAAEAAGLAASPPWPRLPFVEWSDATEAAREIEWFAFAGTFFRRERIGVATQRLRRWDSQAVEPASRSFLTSAEIDAQIARISSGCSPAVLIAPDDSYRAASSMPGAPVFRSVCGDVWFHVDGASGALLERLDPSRRAYRWVYSALHSWDVPPLMAWPMLRSSLMVMLCGLGLLFSVTGVVLGWRRLRRDLTPR
jgi:hypothetical protein